jgi:putative DNA primase/helicase
LVNSSRDYTADLELISFIQEAIGYSLTADVSFHKTFWLFGDEGTGKSTLLYVLEHLLGPSAIPFSLRMLNHDAYQLAELPGIKVLFSTEISRNTRLETDVINSLVSGDTMIARNPYGRPFRLLPRAKIWWAMNYHPSAVNQIEGLGRRLYIVPFHRRFHGTADEVKDLKSLIVGQELPGIFNWALVGLRRLQVNQGFTQSRQIAEETDEFKLANDPPRMFILEMCDVDPNFSVAASDLYDAYRTWCITNGFTPQSIKSVSQDWRRMGFEKQKTKHYNRYLGLQLKP